LCPSSSGELPHKVTLKNRSEVLIRRAGPEDFRILFAMFSSLSDDTMFRRFLRSQKELTEADVQDMLRLDDRNVTSLIAVVRTDDTEQAVGEARYVTNSSGELAEAAVVIADEWQNLGLATALFTDLITEAKRAGLSKVIAYFDSENSPVIHLGQKFGFKLARKETRPDYSMLKAEITI
jgi:RimJ/RimL family protein N-acetyltransferase